MVGRPLLATTCPWGRVRRSSEAPRSPQQGDAIGGAVAAVVDSVVAPDAASSAALPQWALACAQGPGAASSAALPHQAQGGVTGRAAPCPQAGLDLRDTVAPVAGDSPSLAAGGHRQAAASASAASASAAARGGVQTRSAQPWCLLLGGAGQTTGPWLAMLFCCCCFARHRRYWAAGHPVRIEAKTTHNTAHENPGMVCGVRVHNPCFRRAKNEDVGGGPSSKNDAEVEAAKGSAMKDEAPRTWAAEVCRLQRK